MNNNKKGTRRSLFVYFGKFLIWFLWIMPIIYFFLFLPIMIPAAAVAEAAIVTT